MKALVDGDIILYRVGYTVDEEEEWIAIARTNDTVNTILAELGTDDYTIYLSDSANNFRLKLYPEYKANRTQPKPKHYELIKNHLIKEWGAIISLEQEADDALGISQSTDTIICSIDKDLHQIPGNHYNFVKKEYKIVSPEEGVRHFYHQLLTGDVTDNIPGIYGIGPKKAQKALVTLTNDFEFYSKVVEMYLEAYDKKLEVGQILDKILLNGRLLKIRQKEGELWEPPLKPEEGATLLFTLPMQEPCEEFMELMTLETQRLGM